jgi:ABC-2 type transport system ATP-binding protein
MIEVRNLTKAYGERLAVADISFTVNRGEILGFLGQNGAGKTTTMKILTGFMAATSGSVSVAGFDVFDSPLEVKKRVGYLPETPPVYTELLVSEYLDFVADLRGVPKADKKKKIDSAVERCQLGDVRNRLIANLSKGYRQRVGIAQAILSDPEVLILDEPTVGLDPKQVTEARSLIQSFRGERTVIYSTHILSEVAATCDRILVIDKGKIVAQEAITDKHFGGTMKTEIVVQKLSDELVTSLEGISGVRKVRKYENGNNRLIVESDGGDGLLPEMAKAVVSKNAGLLRMSPVQLALEEYYLSLIGAGKRSNTL